MNLTARLVNTTSHQRKPCHMNHRPHNHPTSMDRQWEVAGLGMSNGMSNGRAAGDVFRWAAEMVTGTNDARRGIVWAISTFFFNLHVLWTLTNIFRYNYNDKGPKGHDTLFGPLVSNLVIYIYIYIVCFYLLLNEFYRYYGYYKSTEGSVEDASFGPQVSLLLLLFAFFQCLMMSIGNIIVITVRNDGRHVTTNTWAPGNRNIATTTTPVISKSRAWVGRHLDGGDGEQWGGRWVRARDATSPTYILFIIPFHCHHPPSQPRDSSWCISSPRPKRQFTAIGRFLFTRTTARDANNNDNGPRWCVSHCLDLRWVLLIFLRVLYIYTNTVLLNGYRLYSTGDMMGICACMDAVKFAKHFRKFRNIFAT